MRCRTWSPEAAAARSRAARRGRRRAASHGVGDAVRFWQAVWEALRLEERYAPLAGLDAVRARSRGQRRAAAPDRSNRAATYGCTSATVPPPASSTPCRCSTRSGCLQCHDLCSSPTCISYRTRFRGPGKYDGSVVNWVNGPLLRTESGTGGGSTSRSRRSATGQGTCDRDADGPGARLTAMPASCLPTTVVGSYSVPEWLERLKDDYHQRRIERPPPRRDLEVAIKAALKDQELAGVDVVSDGELRRDNDVDYLLARIPGSRCSTARRPTTTTTTRPRSSNRCGRTTGRRSGLVDESGSRPPTRTAPSSSPSPARSRSPDGSATDAYADDAGAAPRWPVC